MGFFDTILDLGKSVVGFFTGNSLGSNLAKTALLGFGLNKITEMINKSNDAANTTTSSSTATSAAVDPGVSVVVEPDQNNKIPVLYGEAFVNGIITDAHLSNDYKQMTYVFTLAEQTGLKMSDGTPTSYEFEDVYLNDQRVVFKSDGVTVDYTLDREGNQDISYRDLIAVRVYAGGSPSVYQLSQQGGSIVTPTNAYDVVPNWTAYHAMTNLIFAVFTVTYNAEKGLKTVPNILFHLRSDMTQPGDVLYDYVTNTRYGAGIAAEDIFDE